MSESKHTPGPWYVLEGTASVYSGDGERRIVSAEGPGRPAENKANAQLVSAAPDLLEALTSTLELTADAPGVSAKEFAKRIAAARAAIAKAKGRHD